MSSPGALGHDELDIMELSPSIFYASVAPVLKVPAVQPTNLRRSLRSRPSLQKETPEPRSRKRTLSTSALQNRSSSNTFKKLKLDERKANTAVSNEKRDVRDKARKRWLFCHRDILEPLLPENSNFFSQLQKEVERDSKENKSFFPLHELDEQPKLIKGGYMKDYQLQGLSFMVSMYKNGMNCILGDEMGLGKTLQTLSLFAYIKENTTGPVDPHLVICPLSVLSSWEAEAARWLPSMRVIRFHGPSGERERLKNSLRGDRSFDIMFTTYDSYVTEDGWFKSQRWSYCVLDEGHKVKNSDTALAHKLQGFGSAYRLILTGTPVQNNLLELWGLLHWLYPSVFTAATEPLFKNAFDLSRGSYALPFVNASKKFISAIMLRRTKAVVAGNDVPPREELTVFIPLTEAQRFWTYRLLTRLDTPELHKVFADDVKFGTANKNNHEIAAYSSKHTEGSESSTTGGQWKKLMNLLMQLRKVCDHPYLLPNAEPAPYDIAEHIVSTSSKIIAIDKILKDILPKGERVLIFSQWTGMLDLLEDFMDLRSIPFARLDGSTPRPRRSLDIKLFQQEVSPFKVFLISTKAGGLGINLTKATTVIMCDSDWNPQNDLQAIARAHRIGQTKVVKVYRLICQGSVEDQMLDRIRRKLFLSVKIMGSDNSASTESISLGSGELMDILRKGSSALANSETGFKLSEFLSADIADILQQSRTLEDARGAKLKKELKVDGTENPDTKLVLDAEEEEKRLLSGVAQVQSRLFEGRMIHRVQNNTEIASEWRDLEKRARVDRTVTVDGMTFIATPDIYEADAPIARPPAKKTKAKFSWEDWCIHCRDGGDLVCCNSCPRVFHAKCRGYKPSELRGPSIVCSQHSCTSCQRTTSESGGMLFRCRTCPEAFCEDCLPPGDIDAVGDVLPEFDHLDYGQKSNAYYIKCQECREDFAENSQSQFWIEWTDDIRRAEEKFEKKYTNPLKMEI
ncbi:P-loop containing nucleoside triphosphate hydrolase protein [Collybia nuda]|uniref:P-loop containing nucleoside triphosphate hydrolase protein n=1 Tax=Collybia nuda TaxID=64659 RepID=A0A9P5YFK4_9AGAR|nr:P-loop containing nucleoside triphosphate hydrolase protein [Collybia nuda]